MVYMGSKSRIAGQLVPIIQSFITEDIEMYWEPFVGGANVIDKIVAPCRTGSDINDYLIALLQHVQSGGTLPEDIGEELYQDIKQNIFDYEPYMVGAAGLLCTYATKWFGGYARSFKSDGATPRMHYQETLRSLMKQAPHLEGINFVCKNYSSILYVNPKTVIYCDPPYKNATKYKTKFDYDLFYEWLNSMAQKHVVLLSEYTAPPLDVELLWEHKNSVNFTSNRSTKQDRIEKLFLIKPKDSDNAN